MTRSLIAVSCFLAFFGSAWLRADELQLEPVLQTGHSGGILSTAFSPDGKRTLTGGVDQTAILWDVESGKILRQFKGHRDPVSSVAFADGGKYVLTASSTIGANAKDPVTEVILWDARTGEKKRTMAARGPIAPFFCLARDGTRVLVDRDVFEPISGNKLLRLSELQDPRSFSPNGRYLTLARGGTFFEIWDTTTNKSIAEFQTPGSGGWSSLAVTSDGKHALSMEFGGTTILWDAPSGKMRWSFNPGERTSALYVSDNGKQFLTATPEETVLWNIEKHERIQTLQIRKEIKVLDLDEMFLHAALSADGSHILTGSKKGPISVWETATGTRTQTFEGSVAPVVSVHMSADGNKLLTGTKDQVTSLWDLDQGPRIQSSLFWRPKSTLSKVEWSQAAC